MSDQIPSPPKRLRMAPGAVAGLIIATDGCAFGWCYGVPGVIISIISLVISVRARRLLREHPDLYRGQKMADAGFTWSLVGLIQGCVIILVIVISLVVGLALPGAVPRE